VESPQSKGIRLKNGIIAYILLDINICSSVNQEGHNIMTTFVRGIMERGVSNLGVVIKELGEDYICLVVDQSP
jgi:hypothetical protein